MNPVANHNKIETYIKCKKCGTEVSSITNGNLTPCKCGAISVDGSKDLVRVLGKPEDYEEIQNNMNTDTQQFIDEVKGRPDVLGVIMFGSWARGNNRPDSDVDLVVILTEGYRRTVEYKNQQAFEIIYTTAKSALEFWQGKKDDCAGLWAVAKIVYDKDGSIQQLKEKAEEIIKEGKKPIDEYQKGQFKFSAEDEIKAVESMVTKDVATANLVLNYTMNNLTALFFDLRQLWTPAPKQRLAKIKEIKPELGAHFEEFYKDKASLEDKLTTARQIVPLVFEDK